MFKNLLLSLVVCASLVGCFQGDDSRINLTNAEKTFVEQKTVRVGVGPAFPPYAYAEVDNKPVGLSIEYVKEISKRTGLKIVIVQYPNFAGVLEGFAKREIDVVTSIPATIERMDIMSFTSPYISVGSSLLLNELPVNIPLRVGYGRFHAAQEFVERMGTQLVLLKYDDDKKVFFALMNGEVDGAILDNGSARYFEDKYRRRFARSFVDFTYDLRFGVQKDNRILLEILEKGVLSFNNTSHDGIRRGFIRPDDVLNEIDD